MIKAGIKSIRDFNLSNNVVFLRLDLNVPLSDPDPNTETRTITDDTRITEALPTIKHALEAGAKLVIGSHLGRPDGKKNPEFSLEPIALHLANLLNVEVQLAEDSIGESVILMANNLKKGQILLLENLRFYPGEEANDPEFCYKLSRLAKIYINDAFGTAHRKHASVYGVPASMPQRGMGLLIEKELKYLNPLLNQPEQPFYTLLGGSKVTDKIKTIQSLLLRVQGLLIGGAMANAFLKAKGQTLPEGSKEPKSTDIEAAKQIIREAARKEIPLLLPEDSNQGFDIGPKTIETFSKFLSKGKTIFWNGPVGMFEKEEFSKGTFELAKSISTLDALKVVGGGDTVTAVKQSGFSEGFTHLSTGGGAVLEYLEGKGLPGIDILVTDTKRAVDVFTT